MKKVLIAAMLVLLAGCATTQGKVTGALPEGCLIKGNVSPKSGERIYHVPGGRFYAQANIDERKGERWFCSEQDALAAGWRKSRQ